MGFGWLGFTMISMGSLSPSISVPFTSRSSHRRCSIKRSVLKTFTSFIVKHLWWSLQVCNFIKKRLQHKRFPVKFVKYLRTPILKNICERLLLHQSYQTSVMELFREKSFLIFTREDPYHWCLIAFVGKSVWKKWCARGLFGLYDYTISSTSARLLTEKYYFKIKPINAQLQQLKIKIFAEIIKKDMKKLVFHKKPVAWLLRHFKR